MAGAGWWALVVSGALVGLAVRRWWATAAAAALVTGACLAALHAQDVKRNALPPGATYEVAVRLGSSPRVQQGMSGQWWWAPGTITAGAPGARVTVSGGEVPDAAMGDVLVARVRAGEPRSRGESSTLRVIGPVEVLQATSPAARARALMRGVSGDDDPGWLLCGMTLGMDEGLSAEASADMRESGLSHLTAVSGSNCAVLLVLVHWLGGWLRLSRTPRALVSLTVLAAFVLTVGPQPSILRAAFMATLAIAAAQVGGRRAAAHVLQMSAVLLLLVDPWLAYSVGFMLSLAATAGLIALLARGPLSATVAAQVATFPIILAIGGSVGLRTVLSNLLVAPLAAVLPVVGLLTVAAEWILGWGSLLAPVGRRLASMVLLVASWDRLPSLDWIPGWRGVLLAGVVTAVVLTFGRRHVVLATAILVGLLSATIRIGDPWPPGNWWLAACDVGQGDGFVARSQGRVVVVDAGPDPDVMDACLDRLGVGTIDLLVVTHFHADHADGLPGVLAGRQVLQAWTTPLPEPAEQYARAQTALASVPVSTPVPGATATVGAMHVSVVWPQRIIDAGSAPNNASLSLLLISPHGSVALLGDIEPEAQRAILATADIRADIVKVPHHGSAQFVAGLAEAVRPRIALIGVGADNPFGHPAPAAVQAWQQVGATVYTTEDNGDIVLTEDSSVVVRGGEQAG